MPVKGKPRKQAGTRQAKADAPKAAGKKKVKKHPNEPLGSEPVEATATSVQEAKPKTPGLKATGDESTDRRNAELRKELLKRREEILSEAKSEIAKNVKGEKKQMVDTALDEGDWSVVDLSEDIGFRQLSAHRETLRKIDIALRKLAEGTYGICEECGEEISLERLKVLPFAIYCREDQEKKEIMEALEREELP